VTAPLAEVAALLAAAKAPDRELASLLRRCLPALDADGPVDDGLAAVWQDSFLFAVRSEAPVSIRVNGDGPAEMTPVNGAPYWVDMRTLGLGRTHSYDFVGLGGADVAGYTAASHPRTSVRRGELLGPFTVTSSVYPDAATDYWIYANHGVDPDRPQPLMVWLDGELCVGALDAINLRMQTVVDNLVHDGRIPPMVHLLVSPSRGREPLRSVQYDTVSDRYGRHLLDELLPHVERSFRLRSDGYSAGAFGLSSGGACAFGLAWFRPDRFARVHSGIGSFTALQWHPEQHLDGAFIYSELILRERRNLRVWLSSGANDLNNAAGHWPLSNIKLANSLKLAGYDYRFRYGEAGHNAAQAALDLPEALSWLWRDYDSDKTEHTFEQEPTERETPAYEVRIANRDAW
jgi:enterochelin esterase-like enzyme